MKPVVFDVFSRAGGFSLGFEMAGCEVVAAIEHDKWAADTFSYNHPNAKMMLGDIESFDETYLRKNVTIKPDIIIEGPPCQGFSVCNKEAGDPKDPRNSLFVEFIRMAKIFSPSVMVMENVPNIAKAKTKSGEKVINIIKQEFEQLGYYVYRDILSASDYGVPQMRQRFVLIASKKELEHPFPKKTHYVESNTTNCNNDKQLSFFDTLENDMERCPTLWEAISDLPDIEAREGAEEMTYTKEISNNYQQWCRGDDRLKQRKRNGNGEVSDRAYDQNNRRMHPNKICHTITATFYGNFVHPYKNRNFTAREGARIQSFPDDYVFLGKPTVVSKKLLIKEGRDGEAYLCQYSQIGNAVPPLMAKAIAKNIIKQIDFGEK